MLYSFLNKNEQNKMMCYNKEVTNLGVKMEKWGSEDRPMVMEVKDNPAHTIHSLKKLTLVLE